MVTDGRQLDSWDVPAVTVVVPNYNCAALLDAQLAALARQDFEGSWDVVVADNGSTDHTRDVVRRWSAAGFEVSLVDASARRGPSAARNIGLRTARGDWVLFTDADDEVAPGWVAACIAGLANADVAVGWLDYTLLNGLPPKPPQDPSPLQFRYLKGGLGANMAVRRVAFEAVNGFDEQLQVGEDLDFCWRAQRAGLRFVSLPGAVVCKRERATGAERRRQAFGYGRSEPMLYRRFRDQGMPGGFRLTAKTWLWLVITLPLTARTHHRDRWLRVLWLRAGRLRGSFEQRTFYP